MILSRYKIISRSSEERRGGKRIYHLSHENTVIMKS